jgi:hypothetical protein
MRQMTIGATVFAGALLVMTATANGQATAETFSATATVQGAGGASATAPVTITIDRKMAQPEADKIAAAFRTGGEAALRQALVGVAPTGTIRIGGGEVTPTRVTIERTTDSGRLMTILVDKPLLFLGAGVPGAQPRAGYTFAVIDLEVAANGTGTGNIAPAAKITMNQNAFVVQDYGAEAVRLTAVKKTR